MHKKSFSEALRGFVVIVIGVLTALGLEAAWQGWQDSLRGDEYLSAIRSEVDLNAAEAADEQARSLEQASSLHQAVLRVEAGDIEGRELEIAASLTNASRMTGSFPEVSRVVLEDLKSTGNLRLITNDDLRRSIAQAYSRMDSQLQRLDLNSERVGSRFLGYLDRDGLREAFRNGDAAAARAILMRLRSDPEFYAQAHLERERLLMIDFYVGNVAVVMTELSAQMNDHGVRD